MFEKITKFRMLQPRRLAAEPRHFAPANDNRLNGQRPDAARRRRPQPLACHWSIEGGRLVCYWEAVLEPTQPSGPDRAGAFHKPVFVLSYQQEAQAVCFSAARVDELASKRLARVACASLIDINRRHS